MKHRVSNINLTSRTGFCSVCGFVKINVRDSKKGSWRCAVIDNNRRERYNPDLPKKFSTSDYDKMLKDQNGGCGICGSKPMNKRLAVDHCHRTGVIRGLLCQNCNVGIGLFKDNTEIMVSAINYIKNNL